MDDVCGRGFAVLQKDHSLRGKFFIHQGDETDFVAKKVGAKKAGAFTNPASMPTAKQGQYLAFISHYTKLHGQPPSERDMQHYFGTTPPSVHQMVLTLEKRRLIERTPGAARSIRLLVPRDQLPELE
jgi:repressor LexA